MEREDLLVHVRASQDGFRAPLEKLTDLPIIGEVRGDGYFYGLELVKDKATRLTFDADESERLLRGFLSGHCSRSGCTAWPTTATTRWCSWPRRWSATSPTSTRSNRSCAPCSPRHGRGSSQPSDGLIRLWNGKSGEQTLENESSALRT
jgi:hypothetical protein